MASLQIKRRLTKIEKHSGSVDKGKGYIITLWCDVKKESLTVEQGIEQYCIDHPDDEKDLKAAIKSDTRYVIFLQIIS